MNLDQVACTIIAFAGDSKADSLMAIEKAKAGDFETAEELLKTSTDKLLKAHEAHTKLLVDEANNNGIQLKFLLVHASNHLSVGEISREFAEIIVNLYKEVKRD